MPDPVEHAAVAEKDVQAPEGHRRTRLQEAWERLSENHRALAGLANRTAVFCLPGSTGACRTGWEGILRDQLDGRHRPCNFVAVLTGRH